VTVLAFGAAALLALWGTRLCAAAFAAAAVAAALDPGPASAPAVWVACTAAGLVLVGSPVRRLALPAAGVGAVLVAASASNAAAVLPAWTVAAACAVASAGRSDAERRWTLSLLVSDAPFVAAVCWSVTVDGFSTWGGRPSFVPALLFAIAGALRAPLGAGALDRAPETGLLLVRAQSVVLLAVALTGPVSLSRAALVAAPAAFAAGALASRDGVRDAVQEIALVAAALAATRVGWTPAGWAWGALAGGTLLHLVRVSSGAQQWARAARGWLSGGTIGSPLLPVVVAVGAGGARDGGLRGAWAAVLLFAGFALRVAGQAADRRRVRTPAWALAGLVAATAALALWAPIATLPRPPGGEPAPWPPVWAAVLVAAAAAGGGWFARMLAPGRTRRLPPAPGAGAVAALRPAVRPLDVASLRGALAVPLVALTGLAAGLWVIGAVRGFL
jgi:hypothetical protein